MPNLFGGKDSATSACLDIDKGDFSGLARFMRLSGKGDQTAMSEVTKIILHRGELLADMLEGHANDTGLVFKPIPDSIAKRKENTAPHKARAEQVIYDVGVYLLKAGVSRRNGHADAVFAATQHFGKGDDWIEKKYAAFKRLCDDYIAARLASMEKVNHLAMATGLNQSPPYDIWAEKKKLEASDIRKRITPDSAY